MQRRGHAIKAHRESLGFGTWTERAYESVYLWMGHMARMSTYAPQRMSYRMLQHRRYSWTLKQRTPNQDGHPDQGHGRRFHVWWLERFLYKRLGPEWNIYCADKAAWAAQTREHALWRAQAGFVGAVRCLQHARAARQPYRFSLRSRLDRFCRRAEAPLGGGGICVRALGNAHREQSSSGKTDGRERIASACTTHRHRRL